MVVQPLQDLQKTFQQKSPPYFLKLHRSWSHGVQWRFTSIDGPTFDGLHFKHAGGGLLDLLSEGLGKAAISKHLMMRQKRTPQSVPTSKIPTL